MNRRSFVRALALASVTAAIGCTSSRNSNTVDLRQISTDVADITAGLAALASAPSVQESLSSVALNALASALAEAKSMEAQIASPTNAVPLTTAQGWVQTLTVDVGTILARVAAVHGLPAQMTMVMTAIQTLLPLVEAAVSLASGTAVNVTPMTPTEARQILQNLR